MLLAATGGGKEEGESRREGCKFMQYKNIQEEVLEEGFRVIKECEDLITEVSFED